MATKSGRRIGAALVALAVLAVLLIAASASTPLGSNAGSIADNTVTSSSDTAAALVNSSFAAHISLLASKNIPAIVNQYEPNATVYWAGDAIGLADEYVGAHDITLLLNSSFFRPNSTASFVIGNVTQVFLTASGQSGLLNSSFTVYGRNSVWGNYSGSISATDRFVAPAAAGNWLISQETWNFKSFNIQFPLGFVSCSGPNCAQSVQDMAFSQDGNYLAAGTYENSGYGNVYLVATGGSVPVVLWKSVTANTVVWSVAVSSNGSYTAAAGFAHPDPYKHGNGRVYLFNKEGVLLWNVSAGSEPRAVWVAIAANGSRVAADYGAGIIYLNDAGTVLWNHTFPQGGYSNSFAMSSDASTITYGDNNVTIAGSSGLGWGVFYLDSHGNQVWSYTEDHTGGDVYVQMSGDGSRVAASSQRFYNGSVYYFDGSNGGLVWSYPTFPETGIANYDSLVMTSDGSVVAAGGPSTGTLVLNSNGKALWEGSVGGFGEPALILKSYSLVLMFGLSTTQADLVGFNGTAVRSFNNEGGAFAASPDGETWVAAGGIITTGGDCSTLEFFNGTTALPSAQLCW